MTEGHQAPMSVGEAMVITKPNIINRKANEAADAILAERQMINGKSVFATPLSGVTLKIAETVARFTGGRRESLDPERSRLAIDITQRSEPVYWDKWEEQQKPAK